MKRPMDVYVRVNEMDIAKGRISFTNTMGQKVEIDLEEVREIIKKLKAAK